MTFADRRALVTGAGRGLGAAIVAELLDRGAAHVTAAVRQRRADLELPVGDPRVEIVEVDVSDEDAVTALAQDRPVDLLVNNAGVWGPASLFATPDTSITRREMETNFFGTLYVTRAFLPSVRAARGTVVNVLSISALASMPAAGGYSASKAAALSLTQALRAETADDGVTVHAIVAGKMDTHMAQARGGGGTHPAEVARAALDGVERGEFMIFPDAQAQLAAKMLADDPDAFREYLGSRK